MKNVKDFKWEKDLKVKDFVEAGIECSIFLADWHTWINDKLGGDRETIKRVAVGYFKEGL